MKESFRNFVEKLQEGEDLQELRSRPPVPPQSEPGTPSNKREQHRAIDKAWENFLKEAKRLGYVIPTRHKQNSITFHNKKYSPHDLAGRYTAEVS